MKRTTIALASLLLAASALHEGDASACAILPIDGESGPHLSTERVALLYDEDKSVEHFIREVRFDGASGAFAFVVPTPSKPELAAVKEPPFDRLREAFPFDPPPPPPPEGSKGLRAAAVEPTGVEVLSTQRIGKFTAFILAASDGAALDQWLRDNRITLPAGGRPWLDHYVQLRFFFSAFRFEGPGGASGFAAPPGSPSGAAPPPPADGSTSSTSMASETVRLSFEAAVPFYPYLEPAHGAQGQDAPRRMDVWLVSKSERRPRLRRARSDIAPRWSFPWQPHQAYESRRSEVAIALGDLSLFLGDGSSFFVQTFRDERTNRDGWSDIVFPAKDASMDEPAFVATATSLLGDLNRGLQVGVKEPYEDENDALYRVPPRASGCGCHSGGEDSGDELWVALVGLGALCRFRSARRDRRCDPDRGSR